MKMKINIQWQLAVMVGLICCTSTLHLHLCAQESDSLVMVVNKANSISSISKDEAKRLVTGETNTWPNGTPVIVVMQPAGSPDRDAVLKKVCGMTESVYTRTQMQASFTGKTAATIRQVPITPAVKFAVKASPGAFGFIHKSSVDDSVKIVLTVN